ncbi:MAG: DUF3293 domain-containing protein [Verrucomicrobiales bacterium]|nr:DUF3293 domain-containing protein [Verrucomicrobiales bacterium]
MPTELKTEYRNVRFQCERREVPRHFYIITAWNPDGVTIDDSANQRADESLRSEIEDRRYEFFPVTGGSPDFSHIEPGYGIVCARSNALALARQFCQEALFEVIDNRVILVSALDDPGPDEDTGTWSALCRNHETPPS